MINVPSRQIFKKFFSDIMHTDNVELESSSEVCDFADLYTIHEKRNATLPFHLGKKAFLKRKRDESGSATPAKPEQHEQRQRRWSTHFLHTSVADGQGLKARSPCGTFDGDIEVFDEMKGESNMNPPNPAQQRQTPRRFSTHFLCPVVVSDNDLLRKSPCGTFHGDVEVFSETKGLTKALLFA